MISIVYMDYIIIKSIVKYDLHWSTFIRKGNMETAEINWTQNFQNILPSRSVQIFRESSNLEYQSSCKKVKEQKKSTFYGNPATSWPPPGVCARLHHVRMRPPNAFAAHANRHMSRTIRRCHINSIDERRKRLNRATLLILNFLLPSVMPVRTSEFPSSSRP